MRQNDHDKLIKMLFRVFNCPGRDVSSSALSLFTLRLTAFAFPRRSPLLPNPHRFYSGGQIKIGGRERERERVAAEISLSSPATSSRAVPGRAQRPDGDMCRRARHAQDVEELGHISSQLLRHSSRRLSSPLLSLLRAEEVKRVGGCCVVLTRTFFCGRNTSGSEKFITPSPLLLIYYGC